MLIFLFVVIILLQITLFSVILLIYKKQQAPSVSDEPKQKCTAVKNISRRSQFELIKQVIYLEKFTLGFKTPYSGYLYIVVKDCDIYFSDDSYIKVKRELNGLFLEKNELIFIKNPVDLKCVKFVQY